MAAEQPSQERPASFPDLSQKPENLHQRITTSADDEELDPLVENLGDGCGRLYARLEVGARPGCRSGPAVAAGAALGGPRPPFH